MEEEKKRKLIKTRLLFIILFSVLISFLLVKLFFGVHISNYEITVEVLEKINPNAIPNHEVWIEDIQIDGQSEIKMIYGSSVQNGFEFRSAAEYGYSNDAIVNINGSGSKIIFSYKNDSNVNILFWKQALSGIVQLTIKESSGRIIKQETIDLYSSDSEKENYVCPSIQKTGMGIIQIGLCVLFTIFFSFILFFLFRHSIYEQIQAKTNRKENWNVI